MTEHSHKWQNHWLQAFRRWAEFSAELALTIKWVKILETLFRISDITVTVELKYGTGSNAYEIMNTYAMHTQCTLHAHNCYTNLLWSRPIQSNWWTKFIRQKWNNRSINNRYTALKKAIICANLSISFTNSANTLFPNDTLELIPTLTGSRLLNIAPSESNSYRYCEPRQRRRRTFCWVP